MYPSLLVCFSGAFRASSTGSRQASSRPRELHSRLTFPRRLAAGSALPSLSPRRAVRPAPGLRASACLLAAALVLPGALLFSAGEAQAQTTAKLVSTTGQTENTSSTQSRFINDRAQAFTTGRNASGYTLKRIDLPMSHRITNPTVPTYTVKIHNATSSGPGTVRGTLTNPTSVADGNNTYTTAGIDLDPNKTYFVVIDVTGTGGNHHQIFNDITDSDSEDSGTYAGWSIANGSLTRQFQASSWISRGFSWKMAIRGVVKGRAPPPAPAEPTVSGMDGTSLRITWTAVEAAGAATTDYDVRYRRKGDTAWTEHTHDGTALTTTITGLLQGASWEAQVAASNDVGPGQWSDIGAGHTGPARFVRAETSPSGLEMLITFTKKLSQAGPNSAYSITRGTTTTTATSASLSTDFGTVAVGTGTANAVQHGQTVKVSYAKPSGVKLLDADNQEIANFSNKPVTNLVQATVPAAPAAPTVSAVSSSRNLSVSWTAPTSSSSITDYDLRYYAGSSDPDDEDDWVLENESSGLTDPGTSTSATLSGLAASTGYRVQVRAENAAGKGPWSPSGTGTTNASSATNNAPTLAELGTSDCVAKTATTPFKTITASAGTQVGASPILSTANCTGSGSDIVPLCANFNAIVFDYICRQKVQKNHLNWYIVEQLPVAPPERYEAVRFGPKTAAEIVREAVLELTYTAHDMAPFARDMGLVDESGAVLPPYRWDEDRRFGLRAKLDALYFHLYGVTDRDDIRYIYSTFRVIAREEEEAWGRYRSRDLCLAWVSALEAGSPDAEISL